MSDDHVFCTWSYRKILPPGLNDRFRDLDHLIREIATNANYRLVIVAPYLSPLGMATLRDAIAVAAKRGAWIRLVTADLTDENSLNHKAIYELCRGSEGRLIQNHLRILSPTVALPALVHAKLIIADGSSGYMGSANMSSNALDNNFEVGISLSPIQADSLDRLVTYFESEGLFHDVTALFFSA
jgi:phosphatidylserine/phosphatidylglycerophosphate/cardiolipin synthase-like enzyme